MAETYTLVVVTVAHIQTYLFGSNRLQENIGASFLVDAFTGIWAWQAASQVSNQPVYQEYEGIYRASPNVLIDRGSPVEVVYAGGGNFVVLFQSAPTATAFVRTLSTWALELAPGLRLMVDSSEYRWGDPLGEAISSALQRLRVARSLPTNDTPLAGLGITMMCRSTALPAVSYRKLGNEDDNKPVSAEIVAKLDASKEANKRLNDLLLPKTQQYRFPYDLDDLGRTRQESSFIAVVHADGNGIGQQVSSIKSIADPRHYIEAMRSFSESINQASTAALKATLHRILPDPSRRILHIFHPLLPDHGIDLQEDGDGGQIILPFRPLVFGGDDITFVCDGRLGISLTLSYIRAFEEQTNMRGVRATARAGVAITKTHYPFARAYALAEDLADSAKSVRGEERVASLDWHFALSGVHGSLEDMRAREVDVQAGRLTLLPVTVGNNGNLRDWSTIRNGLNAFQGGEWADKRNKQKDLRQALREGKHAVQRFAMIYQQELPGLGDASWSETGWVDLPEGARSVYWDALELTDIHIPLDTQEVADAAQA